MAALPEQYQTVRLNKSSAHNFSQKDGLINLYNPRFAVPNKKRKHQSAVARRKKNRTIIRDEGFNTVEQPEFSPQEVLSFIEEKRAQKKAAAQTIPDDDSPDQYQEFEIAELPRTSLPVQNLNTSSGPNLDPRQHNLTFG